MRGLLTSLISLGVSFFYLFSGVTFAESIRIQNANFALGKSKVIVTGKLLGFGKSNHVIIKDTLTGELLVELSGVRKNFSAKIFRNAEQAVPCSVTVATGDSFATSDIRHAPPDCSNRFTLSGIVTDMALPFATVVVHVGGQTFTTVADENGFYSLDIAAATVGNLVFIEAEAINPHTGETINLINLAGTFSKLLSDPVENVTNVTTAEFALLIEANEGQIPTTEQELRDAETHVDATALLELAAVIKLIVDDPAFTLPEGFDSIVDFVGNPAAVVTFITDLQSSNPDAIADAIVAILEDNDLVEGFVATEIPSFYFAIDRAMPGFLSPNGSGLEFDNTNFTGNYFSTWGVGVPSTEAFDWVVTNGMLEISFQNPVVNKTGMTWVEEITSDQAFIDYHHQCAVQPLSGFWSYGERLASSYTRIVDGTLIDIVRRTDKIKITFDEVPTITALPDCNGEPIQYPPRYQIESNEQTLRASTDITPIPFTEDSSGVEVPGNWAFEYFYNPGNDLYADLYSTVTRRVLGNLLTLNADGSGNKLFYDADLLDQTFTWQIAGHSLVMTYPDGWTQTSYILDQEGKQYAIYSDFTNGTERYGKYGIVIKQDPAFNFSENLLLNQGGTFWNGMINAWHPDRYLADGSLVFPSGYWGWKFDPIPTGTHPYAYVDWSSGDHIWREHATSWDILPDGKVQIYYKTSRRYDRYRFWIPLAEDHITTDPVTGDAIVPSIKRIFVLEHEDQEFEDQEIFRYMQPRINIQQEFEIPAYDIYEFCTFDPNPVCTKTP